MGKEETEVCHVLQIQHKDFSNNGKISKLSYLMKVQLQKNVGHLRYLLDYRRIVCNMLLHPDWEYCLLSHLRNSRSFRLKFFIWILTSFQPVKEMYQSKSIKLCEHCSLNLSNHRQSLQKHLKIKLRIQRLNSTLHNMEPEIRWSIKILYGMHEQLQLEAVFAWLSTLGGAHSALGDHFNKNAEVAWDLSLKQLYIATKIGNLALAAHCKLFMSISLMQRGHFAAASKIIRFVARNIVNDKRLQERRLVNCCKAAKVKLKHMREEWKQTRNGIHS